MTRVFGKSDWAKVAAGSRTIEASAAHFAGPVGRGRILIVKFSFSMTFLRARIVSGAQAGYYRCSEVSSTWADDYLRIPQHRQDPTVFLIQGFGPFLGTGVCYPQKTL